MHNLAPSTLILPVVRTSGNQRGSLYYHEGNFFYPRFNLHRDETVRVRVAIYKFKKANTDLIKQDRAKSTYLDIVELHDLGLDSERLADRLNLL